MIFGMCHLMAILGGTIIVVPSLPGEVNATCLKIGHPKMKSAGTWSSNELPWLNLQIGHQDSSYNKTHQGNIPYSSSLPS